MSWVTTIRAAWGYLFDSEPRRRPRRARCVCGGPAYHPWQYHDKDGCKFCRLENRGPCLLRRNGTPARRALGVVKESA